MARKPVIIKNARRYPSKRWWFLLRPIARPGIRCLQATLILGLVLFPVVPLDESPPTVTLRARRAQEILEDLRAALSIDQQVQIAIVVSDPFVFSVRRDDIRQDNFLLSMELGFLLGLTDDELRAAVAHELGHVWIFTHFPYLQTERLANEIGERVVNRDSFEKLYSKLWRYEGAPGVPFEQLLGPDTNSNPDAIPQPEGSNIPGLTGPRR